MIHEELKIKQKRLWKSPFLHLKKTPTLIPCRICS